MEQITYMLITNLPNFCGFILLAWSNDRTIQRLFKESDRNEREILHNAERITHLETRLEGIEQGLDRLNMTVRDLLMLFPRNETPAQS